MAKQGQIAVALGLTGMRDVQKALDTLERELGPTRRKQAYKAFAAELRKEVRARVPKQSWLSPNEQERRGGDKHLRQTVKVLMVNKRPRIFAGATPQQKWAFYAIIVHQGRSRPTRRSALPFMADGVRAGWDAGIRQLDLKIQKLVADTNRKVNIAPIRPGKLANGTQPPDWRRNDFDILWGTPKGRAAKKVRRK